MSEKTILIVEDNDLNLKLFTDLLEVHGYKVISSQDGGQAKNVAAEEKPDLILMDIQLPNISGIDVIKSIKEDAYLKEIPIIAVTAFAMQDDEEKIMAAGCESYLSKPISIKLFIEEVAKYIR